MGVSAIYNFRSDSDMGIEKIVIRSIPCACNGYLEQLDSVWKTGTIDKKQGRYKTSDRCEMKAIFDGLNNCQVVKLETIKNDDIDEGDPAKEILHGIESRMSENVMKSNYGTMRYWKISKNCNTYCKSSKHCKIIPKIIPKGIVTF